MAKTIFPVDKLLKGNIVQDFKGQLITVNEITEEYLTCIENENLYLPVGVKPVPLTWQIILIAFDFEYYPLDGYEDYWSFQKSGIVIIVSKCGCLVLKNDVLLKCITYVHELQNLYFSLTYEQSSITTLKIDLCPTL